MYTKTAIITGAAKGIGKAISYKLHAEGYRCILVDMDTESGNALARELGNDAVFYPCDISRESDVKKLFASVVNEHGSADVLVNNAGIIRDNVIWRMSVEEFDAVINVNLKGTWLMCREAAFIMRNQQGGRIINIASRAWLGNPGQSNYSSSKAGVVALTRVLALELGKYNVQVNAVAPGLIDTPLTQN